MSRPISNFEEGKKSTFFSRKKWETVFVRNETFFPWNGDIHFVSSQNRAGKRLFYFPKNRKKGIKKNPAPFSRPAWHSHTSFIWENERGRYLIFPLLLGVVKNRHLKKEERRKFFLRRIWESGVSRPMYTEGSLFGTFWSQKRTKLQLPVSMHMIYIIQ